VTRLPTLPRPPKRPPGIIPVPSLLNRSNLVDHSPPFVSSPAYSSKGYIYSAPIRGRLSLLHESSGRVWKLTGDGPWTIGRSRDNSVCLQTDPYLSRRHGKIEIQNNVPFVVDLGTRTGLQLNEEPVTVYPLKPGDIILMAQTKFLFQGMAFGPRWSC